MNHLNVRTVIPAHIGNWWGNLLWSNTQYTQNFWSWLRL